MFDHSADLTQRLHARWRELCAPSANDSACVESLWEQLREHYCEPRRAYHNLTHIAALLQLADRERQQLRHPSVIEFAIWFHDLVYDTHAGDNEQRSAQQARLALQSLAVEADSIAAVEQCILATQHHQVPPAAPPDLPLFLDFDLSILGAPEPVYCRYSGSIRAEYAWVPDADYRKGRTDVLRRFADRPALYFTPQMAARFEVVARHNIETELQELASS
jgi:predicted metal-dependent HD superfamily phosphohydrolase